jgi:hypothetical protein
MAYITIPALPAGTALTGLEVFESVQSSTSVKLTANQIKDFASVNPTLVVSDTATNTVSTAATLEHVTTGTVLAGFGTGLTFASETGGGAVVNGTALQSIVTDPTAGLEFFDFAIRSVIGGAQTEVARFTSAFELGVNTTNPQATFHGVSQDLNINGVTSVVRADHTTLSGVAGNGIGSAIEFGVENDAGNVTVGASIDAVAVNVSSSIEDFDFVFNLMSSGTPMAEVMRLKYTGNVGIGTPSPQSRLEVFLEDINDDDPVAVARFTHATSGTPQQGIGTGVEFVTETSSNTYKIGGSIYTQSTILSSGQEVFDIAFAAMVNGNPNTDVVRITNNNNLGTVYNPYLGVNTTSPDRTIHGVVGDAVTNTSTPVLRLTHTTINTPVAGFGAGIEFQVETVPNGNLEIGGIIDAVASTVTSGAEDFDFVLKTMSSGSTASEKLRVGEVVYTPKPFGAGTVPTPDAWIHAGAGTATVALMDLDPGVLLTTPFQGAVEYDGKSLYFTPNGTQRAVLQSMQMFQLDANRSGVDSSTVVQTIFGKKVSVQAGTRYQYEINFTVTNAAASAKALQYAFVAAGTTATLTAHDYEVVANFPALAVTPTASTLMQNRITTGFTTAVTVSAASAAAAAAATARIRGSFDVSVAGTVEFGFALSVGGTSVTIIAGSSVSLWPVGATGANTEIGDWS